MLLAVLHNPVKGFELDVLDVGQGDGMYLHTKEGTNFFFDGGSTDVSKVGTYRDASVPESKGCEKNRLLDCFTHRRRPYFRVKGGLAGRV